MAEREFPALDAWRIVGRHRAPGGTLMKLMIRPPRNANDDGDFIWTADPLRAAACYEADAREWLALARHFERRAAVGDDESAAACLRACDELLERSIDILAAAERAEGAADAA